MSVPLLDLKVLLFGNNYRINPIYVVCGIFTIGK